MRKLLSVFVLIAVFCSSFLLTACKEDREDFDINFMVDNVEYYELETYGKKKIVLPDNPQKDGYTFIGWYFDNTTFENEFTENSFIDTYLSSDINVYAKFIYTSRKVDIVYNMETGATQSNVTCFDYNDTINLQDATKQGKTFDGWYLTPDYSGEKITNLSFSSLGFVEILSESMNPILSLGEVIRIEEKDNYEVADIVKFSIQTYPVVHRIVRIMEDNNGDICYILRGDNVMNTDGSTGKDYLWEINRLSSMTFEEIRDNVLVQIIHIDDIVGCMVDKADTMTVNLYAKFI